MEKIAINIYYSNSLEISGNLEEVFYGIEEEGLPWLVTGSDEKDSKVLGNIASQSSKLGVGIGIGVDGVTLHHDKLEKYKPLFTFPLSSTKETFRMLGMNGARLIKGEPFVIPKGGK
ncbi:glycerol dehydratase reactivase beta/small subunit family protein [uncultured Ilyobacter sp.]|uniref:glycerol dehydratase reactivase beta/small subunit family protein n=1 Tax=uncultured Ilyobacter sp. TaxID=544433 RepID=UPI002AA94700|nr:glycerol dehydratase reactivase beta/small subunit family protein [uncultured Ilyobacter sp.]